MIYLHDYLTRQSRTDPTSRTVTLGGERALKMWRLKRLRLVQNSCLTAPVFLFYGVKLS